MFHEFFFQDDIKVANPKWAKHVKRKLMDAARLEYSMMFYNNLLRKLSGGKFYSHSCKLNDHGNARRITLSKRFRYLLNYLCFFPLF